MTLLARINEPDKRQQLLSEHLSNVAKLSASFSESKNLSRLIAILHDLGKAISTFQDYLKNGGERGSVVHSRQGAFFLDDYLNGSSDIAKLLLKEIVALSTMAHHGSLYDGISPDGRDVFLEKLTEKENERYRYLEAKRNSANVFSDLESNINELVNLAKEEINTIVSQINNVYHSRESAQFALGLFVKYIYSCLIDADRLDAYSFDINEQTDPVVSDWASLINTFEEKIRSIPVESEIAAIRQSISSKCKEAAIKHTGIYQLSVPTGGGKTLSSLRFALHHCKTENKERIIYVIPYLSIIEQTAAEFHNIFNLNEDNNILLEHHSSIVLPDDEEEQKSRKLAAARWDAPIIITTMVQFLETVMSAKGSDLRKFHHMSNAVIIFDEIQSLPIKTIHVFNEVASFLAKVCNTTILLCTATQPLLGSTERENLLLEDEPDLVDTDGLFENIRRTVLVAEAERDIDAFADFVEEKALINRNCLAIVNTKSVAREVFDKLKSSNSFTVFYLSTYMCSTHRADTIARIKKALSDKDKIICVATQLIEAGVDISFKCVVRAAAGLDSVTQAAGRCNRNEESKTPKEVYIVPLKNENLDKLDDIKCGKDITERMIRENSGADLLSPAIMKQFYEHYFYNRRNLMDYRSDNGSIYDMLSINNAGRGNYKNRTGKECPCLIAQAFRTASEKFSVIDKNTESVVVQYSEAEKLMDAYRQQPNDRMTKTKLNIIRKLEKYSVSLYSWEIDKLAGAISILDEETGIRFLDKFHYAEDIGVVFEADPNNYIV